VLRQQHFGLVLEEVPREAAVVQLPPANTREFGMCGEERLHRTVSQVTPTFTRHAMRVYLQLGIFLVRNDQPLVVLSAHERQRTRRRQEGHARKQNATTYIAGPENALEIRRGALLDGDHEGPRLGMQTDVIAMC
jgi:hypothetical protein